MSIETAAELVRLRQEVVDLKARVLALEERLKGLAHEPLNIPPIPSLPGFRGEGV